MEIIKLSTANIAYHYYRNQSDTCLVVETALAASCAEWWHLAEKWQAKYSVLVYDRAGYGLSSFSKIKRDPENVAGELHELLSVLGIKKIILIGHSMGGLFTYQYILKYPENIIKLILIDPVSPSNNEFKKKLTKSEFKMSGVDKSANLKFGLVICTLHLGWLFKPLLKKAPPFYYYDNFSPGEKTYILKNALQRKTYRVSIEENSLLREEKRMNSLAIKKQTSTIPLYLILHTPERMIKEIGEYGGADSRVAEKIESIWQEIMKEYLGFSSRSKLIQAKNSGHMVHLTDPECIWDAIEDTI